MDGVTLDMLNGAVAQGSELKEKVKELKRRGLNLTEEERFLKVCDALNDVTDITIKLNTALRHLDTALLHMRELG